MARVGKRIERWLKKRSRVLRGIDCLLKPTIRVEVLQLGSSYGGWAICPAGIDAGSVVYSLGVGGDITFDTELINRFGVTVHGFDPTPSALNTAKIRVPDRFIFHDYGIAARDGDFPFVPVSGSLPLGSHTIILPARPASPSGPAGPRPATARMKRLAAAMRELGHDHIDILKMDIEGAEWEVIADVLQSRIPVYQLLVEFHHLRFRSVGVKATIESVRLLGQHGYDVFYVSEKGQEYGFIRRDLHAARAGGILAPGTGQQAAGGPPPLPINTGVAT
jgi:FkbM family methyltransferase